MDNLTELVTIKQVRQALEKMPFDVNGVYHSTMTRILQQSHVKAKLAKQVLSWCLLAKRPLRIDEIQHALAVEANADELDIENICSAKLVVSSCLGLVTLGEQDQSLHLLHLTAKGFLEDKWKETLDDLHLEVARTCLRYLSFREFQETLCQDSKALEERLSHYPFLSYAAYSWGDHVRRYENELQQELTYCVANDRTRMNSVQCLQFERWKGRRTSDSSFEAIPKTFSALHVAAFWGLESLAKSILEENKDFSARDSFGWTPLHYTCARGHIALVRLFLSLGAETEDRDKRGWTPLFWAVLRSHTDIVTCLLKHGARIEGEDVDERRVLHVAVSSGNAIIVQLLLAFGANPHVLDQHGTTPLQEAIMNSKTRIVELLLAKEILRPAEAEASETALQRAASVNDQAKFDMILKMESTVFQRERRRNQLTHVLETSWAMRSSEDWNRRRYPERIQFNPWDERVVPYANYILHDAVFDNQVVVIRCLLQSGVDLSHTYGGGQTVLHVAAFRDNEDISTLLIEKGADPMAQDRCGQTALHFAAALGHEGPVRRLSKHEQLTHTLDRDGSSALHLVWGTANYQPANLDSSSRIRILENLYSKGVELDLQNSEMKTSLHYAAATGGEGAIARLLELGADPNIKDEKGQNVVHVLAESDEKEDRKLPKLRKILQQDVIELLAEDGGGHTPLYLALHSKHWKLAKTLLEGGATLQQNCDLTRSLFDAVEEGNEVALELLYQLGAKANAKNSAGEPLLLFAVRALQVAREQRVESTKSEGSHEVGAEEEEKKKKKKKKGERALSLEHQIRMLLDHEEEDVDAQDTSGMTALIAALHDRANENIVHLLLERGASVHQRSSNSGIGALEAAALSGYESYMHLLLSLTADTNTITLGRTSAITLAAANGFDNLVQILIDGSESAPPSEAEPDWMATAQMYKAAKMNNMQHFQSVVDRRLVMDLQDKNGQTALYKACSHGNEPMVAQLLLVGADVNLADDCGWTPLHITAVHGHDYILRNLVEHGARPDGKTRVSDKDYLDYKLVQPIGATALHLAAYYGHLESVRTLLDADDQKEVKEDGKKLLDAPAVYGRTALMCATQGGHLSIVKLLIEKGADVNASGGAGSWAFAVIDLAHRHPEIMRLLAANGAQTFEW